MLLKILIKQLLILNRIKEDQKQNKIHIHMQKIYMKKRRNLKPLRTLDKDFKKCSNNRTNIYQILKRIKCKMKTKQN